MTKTDILKLAELGKLELSEEELVWLEAEFSKFLQQIAPIKEMKIDGEIAMEIVGMAALREDVVKPSLTREEIFEKAPKSDGEYFVVPQVRD